MSLTEMAKRRWLWLVIGIPVALVVLVVGGTFVYIHFIEADPPPPLTFSSDAGELRQRPAGSTAPVDGGVDGTWNATDASVVRLSRQGGAVRPGQRGGRTYECRHR